MIQEAYCSYEVAKLLKEKGFDESTSMVYTAYGDLCKLNGYDGIRNSNYNDITKNCFEYTAPTHQMAMKWLREEHKLHIGIARGPKGYHITIETIPLGVVKYITREIVGTNYVDSYEEAVEAALKCILENLI